MRQWQRVAALKHLDRRQSLLRLQCRQRLRECGGRGLLEEPAERDFQRKALAYQTDQPGGQQGMATQRKKAIVDADPLDTEDFLPDGAELLLCLIPRTGVRLTGQITL